MATKIACCYSCAFAFLDREHTLECIEAGVMNWPACANHPDFYGRMKRTPARGICPNYRLRPDTPEGDVRQIALGDGFTAYVDAADYEWLGRWKWHMQGGYAIRYEKKKLIFMHHQIAQPPRGMIVDHKNRNQPGQHAGQSADLHARREHAERRQAGGHVLPVQRRQLPQGTGQVLRPDLPSQ